MKRYLLPFCFLFTFTLIAQTTYINENFNASSLPTGWTTSAVSGTHAWSFGINASNLHAHIQNTNLNGTPMAFFDDDSLGANSTNNTSQLSSPFFDNSLSLSTTLQFEYNFREFALISDSFYVEIFDGVRWNEVFLRTTNDCGNYLGSCAGNFPTASIDISAYRNVNCQVRFTYHDGNDWGWYVGIDNVRVYDPISTSIKKTRLNETIVALPNPNNGIFNLKATTELIGKTYQIFDMRGSVVKQARIGSTLSQIELNQVGKGIYFLKIEGINKVEKLVIQ